MTNDLRSFKKPSSASKRTTKLLTSSGLSAAFLLTSALGSAPMAQAQSPSASPSASVTASPSVTPVETASTATPSETSTQTPSSAPSSVTVPTSAVTTAQPTQTVSTAQAQTSPAQTAQTAQPTTTKPQARAGAQAAEAPADPNAENHISLGITQTSNATQESGSTFSYNVRYACSSVDNDVCAVNPVITIPLPAGFKPEMGTFRTSDSPTTNAQIKSVVTNTTTNAVVVTLNDLKAGSSGVFSLYFDTFTKNNSSRIPNNTKFVLTPTLTTTDGHDPVVGNSVTSTVTASTSLNVGKNSDHIYYSPGQIATYTLRFDCYGKGLYNAASLAADHVTLTDTLPDVLHVLSAKSANPDAKINITGNVVTAVFPSNSLKTACSGLYNEQGAPITDKDSSVIVTAKVDEKAVDKQVIDNTVTGTLTPFDNSTNVTDSHTAHAQVELNPNYVGSMTKVGRGPYYTAAGDDNQKDERPNYPYANGIDSNSDSSWTISTYFPNRDQVAVLADSLPCFDNPVKNPNGKTEYKSPEPGALCKNVAWNVESIYSSSASDMTAPVTLTLTDGSTVSGVFKDSSYVIPKEYVGRVASITLGTAASPLVQPDMYTYLDINGRASSSLALGDEVTNIARMQAYDATTKEPTNLMVDDSSLYMYDSSIVNGFNTSSDVTIGSPNQQISPYYKGQISGELQGDFTTSVTLPSGVTSKDVKYYVDHPYSQLTVDTNVTSSDFNRPLRSDSVSVTTNASGQQVVTYIYKKESIQSKLVNKDQGFSFTQVSYGFFDAAAPGTYTGSVLMSIANQPNVKCDNDAVAVDLGNTTGCSLKLTVNAALSIGGGSTGITKWVKGDKDADWQSSPSKGHASSGGTGSYKMSWKNFSDHKTGNVVLYDVLPYVGDTGILDSTKGNARKSTLSAAFAGMDQVPSTATVYYSTSSNPCRPELGVNAACDDVWTSTVPADLSTVKALKVVDKGAYEQNQGFDVTFKVSLPNFQDNQVAWNTFAQSATDLVTGEVQTPTETAKVGLTSSNFSELTISKALAGTNTPYPKLDSVSTFDLAIINTGDTTLTNVVPTDTLADGMVFVSATDGGVLQPDGKTVVWPAMSLNPGQSVTHQVAVKFAPDVKVFAPEINRLKAKSDQVAGTPTDETKCLDDALSACAVIVPTLDTSNSPLIAHKSVDQKVIQLGEHTLTYDITVTNPSDSPWPVTGYTDMLPKGASNVKWVNEPILGKTYDTYDSDSNVLMVSSDFGLTDIPLIQPGQTVKLATVTVDVNPSELGQKIINGVRVEGGNPNGGSDGSCSADYLASPDLNSDYGTPGACATTEVFSKAISVHKVSADGSTDLNGSTFAIYNVDPSSQGAQPMAQLTGNGALFKSDNLTSGTYWLVETKAPEGHNLLATPVKFTLDSNGITLADAVNSITVQGDDKLTIQVADVPAFSLPQTGGEGMGASILPWMLMSGAALSAAGITIVRRRAQV